MEEKYFDEFKRLTRKRLGEEAYNKLTEQELLDSATSLITLVEAVYKPLK